MDFMKNKGSKPHWDQGPKLESKAKLFQYVDGLARALNICENRIKENFWNESIYLF